MYKLIGKRVIDFTIALVAFIILSPVFFLLCILLLITNRGTPFFVQPRPGLNAKVFNLIKFKTMNERTYPDGTLLPDSERLTKLGKLLRDISFDELPQLLNVLKGDMSLVGPRPLLVDYLSLYSLFEKRRHEVRPGITGWAQINGRNLLTWEQKFKLDLWYVDHISFWLDAKIFFKTILKIIRREGVSSKTSITMEKFKGNL